MTASNTEGFAMSDDAPEATIYSFIDEASLENAYKLLNAFTWPAQPFSKEESDLFEDYCRHAILMRAHKVIAAATKQKVAQDRAQSVYDVWLKEWVARVLASLTLDTLVHDQDNNTLLHSIADNSYDDDVIARDCFAMLMGMGLSTADGGRLVTTLLQHANGRGYTPLHLAISHRKFYTAYGFIEAGANIHTPVLAALQPRDASSSTSGLSVNTDIPLVLAIKVIEDAPEEIRLQPEFKPLIIEGQSRMLPIHPESALQFAKNLLNYDAVLPTFSESSELVWKVGILIQSIQTESAALIEKMKLEETQLKAKGKWLAPKEKGPIIAKRAAINNLLNELSTTIVAMSSSEHSMPRVFPVVKKLRDWIKKYPDYYQALKATTFLLDTDAFKIIQEILATVPEHYIQKHAEVFNAPDRRSNPASKHARYHPPASGDSIGEAVVQTPKMAYKKFREKLKEYMAQIGPLQEMLYQKAFELIQSYEQLMLQVDLDQRKKKSSWLNFQLPMDESAILAGALWDWAMNTREKEDIKRAIDAWMEDYIVRSPQESREFPGTFSELSNSQLASRLAQSTLKKDDQQSFSHIINFIFNYYTEEELRHKRWWFVIENEMLFKDPFSKPKILPTLQLTKIHPLYGLTPIGALSFLQYSGGESRIKRLLRAGALQHLTLETIAQERGGNTYLHLAAASGNHCASARRDFFEEGLMANDKDSLSTVQRAPLIAAMLKHYNQYGEMPLHVALRAGNLWLAEYFIKLGANVNAPAVGNSPFAFSSNNAAEKNMGYNPKRSLTLKWLNGSENPTSSSSAVDEVYEMPVMILLHLIQEVQSKEPKISTNYLFKTLESLLNYDAVFPEIPIDSLLIPIQEELFRRIRDAREAFLLKITVSYTLLNNKHEWLGPREKQPILNKMLAITSFLETYAKDSSNPATPMLKIFRDWARDHPSSYLALRKTTFMFDSDTCQLINELLEVGPVYYREKYKEIFEPKEAQRIEPGLSEASTSAPSLAPRDKKLRDRLTHFSESEKEIKGSLDEQAKKMKKPSVVNTL